MKEEKTSNSQNLNVHIHNSNNTDVVPTHQRMEHYEGDPDITVIYPEQVPFSPPTENSENKENVYSGLSERGISEATERVRELETLVREKNNVCQALSLIIDLLQNNPVKINTFVIPSEDTLVELIKLLCDCDSVELRKSYPDVECCGAGALDAFIIVDSILITKSEDTFNLKYNCPAVIKILDDHHISYKYIKTR
jgi:hypothetical protein